MILNINKSKMDDLLIKTENLDLEVRIKYFSFNLVQHYSNHIIALENNKIIGILAYQDSYNYPNCLHIEYISVDQEYQNKGISSLLLMELINLAKDLKMDIALGGLSQDGRSKVLPKLITLCEKYNVNLQRID